MLGLEDPNGGGELGDLGHGEGAGGSRQWKKKRPGENLRARVKCADCRGTGRT